MSAHTPGPWAFAKYSAKRFGLGCAGNGAWAMIQPVYTDANDPQMIANVRIMAAAPELLGALQAIVGAEDDSADIAAMQLAMRAIAKATGEPQ